MSALLPLFPLDVVLLPGAALPLHVFEPRYKEMITECLAAEKPFGVVRVKEEGVAEIGCTAKIVAVTKKYDDGRMDIVTEGRERFEVMQVNQERSYLQAEVLYLQDEPANASTDQVSRAVEMHGEIMRLAGAEPERLSAIDASGLSFHLAGSLPLDLDFKQKLLALRGETQRIAALTQYLEAVLPKLRRSAHAREKAGGNGHAR